MSNIKIALILNAFVFPGTGQLHLAQKRRGSLFITATLGVVAYLTVWIVQQFYQIVLDMQMRGESTLAILKLVPEIKAALYNTPMPTVKYLFISLFFIWLLAIIDIFYLTRKKQVQ